VPDPMMAFVGAPGFPRPLWRRNVRILPDRFIGSNFFSILVLASGTKHSLGWNKHMNSATHRWHGWKWLLSQMLCVRTDASPICSAGWTLPR